MHIGLYVHIPFCISKCRYCDFNSRVAPDRIRQTYLQALKIELQKRLTTLPITAIPTVFFGGGTPTIYPVAQLARLVDLIKKLAPVADDAEISIESNPDTIDREKLRNLRDAGFNRLSIGVQSLNDAELKLLGRTHTADGAREAVRIARETFDNLSIDLISGLPGQSVAQWEQTLQEAVTLSPDHISAYGLMLEEGTPLHEMVHDGELPPIDDDVAADMYELTQQMLSDAGFGQYEISNYARPGMECRHNQIYWKNEPYVGCGAGAVSYIRGARRKNISDPVAYKRAVAVGDALAQFEETLERQGRAAEAIMLGLRTSSGVDLQSLSEDLGIDLEKKYADEIRWIVALNLGEYDSGRLRLNPRRGFALHSEIASRFF
ncbi:MAG: radical SAM family heme chaperone HemW [Armatimonadota bacterium]